MKKALLFLLLTFMLPFPVYSDAANLPAEQQNITLVKNMFREFAEKLNINTLDTYYSKSFVLESNGKQYSYQQYKDLETNIYKTLKSLNVVKYNDIFSAGDKVVSRMQIRLIKKNGEKNTFEVILIALIKDHKIERIWEITYPSWSKKLGSH